MRSKATRFQREVKEFVRKSMGSARFTEFRPNGILRLKYPGFSLAVKNYATENGLKFTKVPKTMGLMTSEWETLLVPPEKGPFPPPYRIGYKTFSPTVRALMEAIKAENALDRLPVLADALEESGCDETLGLLKHLRAYYPYSFAWAWLWDKYELIVKGEKLVKAGRLPQEQLDKLSLAQLNSDMGTVVEV
jgi:hypothetical protein